MTYPAHGSMNFVARWAEESPTAVLEECGCRVSFPEPSEGCRLSATWLNIFDSDANCLLGIKLEREVRTRERERDEHIDTQNFVLCSTTCCFSRFFLSVMLSHMRHYRLCHPMIRALCSTIYTKPRQCTNRNNLATTKKIAT
jgi:hypothetical protein